MAESAAAPADWEEPAILRCWWHSPGLMWQYSPPTAKPQTHVNTDNLAITVFCQYCVSHDTRTSRASCWTLPAPWTLSREKRSLKCPMHSVSEPTVRIKIISIITNKPLIIWSSSQSTWVVLDDVAESFESHLGPAQSLSVLLRLHFIGLSHGEESVQVLRLRAHVVQETRGERFRILARETDTLRRFIDLNTKHHCHNLLTSRGNVGCSL